VEKEATFCLIKDGTFFTPFCITNPAKDVHQRANWAEFLLDQKFAHFRVGEEKNLTELKNLVKLFFHVKSLIFFSILRLFCIQ
jgi:hypothetical protein